MWIKGSGEYACRLVNMHQIKYLSVFDDGTLKAVPTKGMIFTLAEFDEKSDGIAMIQKIGKLIAQGCRYFDLENPDELYFRKKYDPQER